MNVEVIGVVMNAVGVANGIVRMKTLREFSHDLLRRGLQHAIGIDSCADELVVKRLGHREDEPVLNDGIFGRRSEFPKMIEPGF